MRESIKSSKANIQNPVKSTGLDDDDKTVLADTTPLSEQIKINETSARAILKKYNDKPDEINLKNLDSEGFIKLKGLVSKLGLPNNIQKLGKFREYLSNVI